APREARQISMMAVADWIHPTAARSREWLRSVSTEFSAEGALWRWRHCREACRPLDLRGHAVALPRDALRSRRPSRGRRPLPFVGAGGANRRAALRARRGAADAAAGRRRLVRADHRRGGGRRSLSLRHRRRGGGARPGLALPAGRRAWRERNRRPRRLRLARRRLAGAALGGGGDL